MESSRPAPDIDKTNGSEEWGRASGLKFRTSELEFWGCHHRCQTQMLFFSHPTEECNSDSNSRNVVLPSKGRTNNRKSKIQLKCVSRTDLTTMPRNAGALKSIRWDYSREQFAPSQHSTKKRHNNLEACASINKDDKTWRRVPCYRRCFH